MADSSPRRSEGASSSRSTPKKSNPQKQRGDGTPKPRRAAAKPKIAESKPPREWRRSRRGEGKKTRAPRVARGVAAAESQPPAGSAKPAAALEPSAYPPSEPTPSPAAHDESVQAPSAAIPEPVTHYGLDRLVLLVRDPYWVYAWWELKDETLHATRERLTEEGQVVLRIYDISLLEWDGHNHHEHFDVEITDAVGNWYIELDQPGASYCAELGLRAKDGRFICMIRSNFVTLPRDSMSSIVDEEWMVLEEDYRKLFELSGGGSIGLGSGEILRMLEERLRLELSSGMVSSFGVSSAAAIRKKTV